MKYSVKTFRRNCCRGCGEFVFSRLGNTYVCMKMDCPLQGHSVPWTPSLLRVGAVAFLVLRARRVVAPPPLEEDP